MPDNNIIIMKKFYLLLSTIFLFQFAFSQNTGIGNVNFTPQSILHTHINAGLGNLIQMTNTTTGLLSTDGLALYSNGNDFSINNREAGYLSFFTSNLERMRILSGGYVGIGLTAPTHQLTIQSGTISTVRLIGPGAFGSTARLNFGDGNYVYIEEDADDYLTIYGSNRTAIMGGNVGIGLNNPIYNLELNGSFGFGNGTAGTYRSRTETRNDAGLQGNAGAQSGFFEFSQTIGNSQDYNYPSGYGSSTWWHLIDCRHSNSGNNYALQISGNFFDQRLFFRKTAGAANTAWSEVLTTSNGVTNSCGTINYVPKMTSASNIGCSQIFDDGTNVGIGTAAPTAKMHVNGSFRLTNGTEALGRVLTSDANGTGTWQVPSVAPVVYAETTSPYGSTTVRKTITVTTTSATDKVLLFGEFDYAKNGTASYVSMGIWRGGVEIAETSIYSAANADNTIFTQWVDLPGVGTFTYNLMDRAGAGGYSTIYGSMLTAIVFK